MGGKAIAFVPRPDGSIWFFGDTPGLSRFVPATGTFGSLGDHYEYLLAATLAADGSVLVMGYRVLGQYDPDTGAFSELARWSSDTHTHSVAITPY